MLKNVKAAEDGIKIESYEKNNSYDLSDKPLTEKAFLRMGVIEYVADAEVDDEEDIQNKMDSKLIENRAQTIAKKTKLKLKGVKNG